MGTLCFEADVDPVHVSVNRHYKNQAAVPPEVRRGMNKVRDAVRKEIERTGFTVGVDDLFSLTFDFYFRTWAGDIDNPIKRTQDAIIEGLNREGQPKVDDKSVIELHVRKHIADRKQNPRIAVCLRLRDNGVVKTPEGQKKPTATATWVG